MRARKIGAGGWLRAALPRCHRHRLCHPRTQRRFGTARQRAGDRIRRERPGAGADARTAPGHFHHRNAGTAQLDHGQVQGVGGTEDHPGAEGESVRGGQVLARIDPQDAQARLEEKNRRPRGRPRATRARDKNRANNLALLKQNFISQNAYDSVSQQLPGVGSKAEGAGGAGRGRKKGTRRHHRYRAAGRHRFATARASRRKAADRRQNSDVGGSAEMEVEASVPASDIPRISVGQEASFHVEATATAISIGRIDRINPATQAGSRSILIYAMLPNRDGHSKRHVGQRQRHAEPGRAGFGGSRSPPCRRRPARRRYSRSSAAGSKLVRSNWGVRTRTRAGADPCRLEPQLQIVRANLARSNLAHQ